MRKYLLIFALLGISFLAFGTRYQELELFSHVLNFIESRYFQPVQTKKLIHGAIKGMLNELDPHSHFFTPKESKAFQNQTQDKAFMLGLEVDKKKGDFIVLSVIKGSPSAKAGLRAGDKIIGLNKERTRGLTLVDMFQKLQKKGQKEFLVRRSGSHKPLKIKVRPGIVKLKSVKYKVFDKKYLYLRIYQFSFSSFFKVNKVLKANPPKKGLLIDLRGNPGGVFEQVVKIADLFLADGLIVSYKQRGEKPKAYSARKAPTLPYFPIVILIDEHSASGSEILAGALKDRNRALIVGRTSFGKGSVQSFFQLGQSGHALKLTIGEYKTPFGYPIHQKGIVPHIIFAKKPGSYKRESGADEELRAALEVLKNFQKHEKNYLHKS